MSSLNNWYAFYVGDYLRDTAHLSMVEHGAYRLLLDHYYSTENPLPDDDKQLHRICRAFDKHEQDAIKRVLQLFFVYDEKEGVYKNKKADFEIEKKRGISRVRSQAAKNKGKKAPAKAKQLHSKSKAIADTSTSTSTSTLLSKDNRLRPADVSQSVWDDFVKMRKSKKAVVSDTVINKIQKEGAKINWSLEQCLETMVMRNWQGFNSEWINGGKNETTERNKKSIVDEADAAMHAVNEEYGFND